MLATHDARYQKALEAHRREQARKLTGGAGVKIPLIERYLWRGAAKRLHETTAPEVIITGPYECLAGETRIFNPADKTEKTIAWYHENKIAPTVLTMFGEAKAEIPFIKGYTALYRVTLDNGYSFLATANHRVLTPNGWMPVSSVISLPLLGCAPNHRESSLEPYPSTRALDALSFSRKVPDYQDDCFSYLYQCDVQPRRVEDTGLSFSPSLDGVPLRSHADHDGDDLGTLPECIHPYLQSFRRSNVHSFLPAYSLKKEREECCVFEDTPLPVFDLFQPHEQCQLDNLHWLTSLAEARRFSHKQLSFSSVDSPLSNYTILASTVIGVEYERDDYYYDLHVPVYGHYLAEGVFHHNTGKTLSALSKLHNLLATHPNAQALMVRKTHKSLIG